MLSPEKQDEAYAKIVDDRDVAMKVARSMSEKLEIIAKHAVIKNKRLRVVIPVLTKQERRTLSECLEVVDDD